MGGANHPPSFPRDGGAWTVRACRTVAIPGPGRVEPARGLLSKGNAGARRGEGFCRTQMKEQQEQEGCNRGSKKIQGDSDDQGGQGSEGDTSDAASGDTCNSCSGLGTSRTLST